MATLGDSQSLFADKPWTVWEELIESNPRNEEKPLVSDVPVKSDSASDSMKLRKEDMYLFGLCPSQDEFYLVVCDRCGQVVKPQALETHLEQRHGNIPTKKSPTAVSPSTIASKTSSSSSPATTSTIARSSQPSTPSSPRPSPRASPKLTKPMAPFTKMSSAEINSLSSKDMHKIKRNHSMPVVKVERIPSPLAMKKGRVSLPPEKAPPDLKRKHVSSTTSNSTHGVTPPNVGASTSMPSLCPTTTVMTTSITTFALTTITSTTSSNRTPSPASVSPPSLHPLASPAAPIHSPAPRTPTPLFAPTPLPLVSIPPPTPTPPPAVSACVPSPVSLPPKLVPVNVASPPVRVATQPSRRLPKEKPPKERKLLLCKDREFDADKHCGAWIQDISRQCTRSLTCKTHALSLRRAVVGRSKSFDDLLREHRAAKEALVKRKALAAQANKKAAPGGLVVEELPKPVESRSAPALNGASSQKALAQALMAPTPLSPLKLAKPTNRIPNSLQRPAFSPPAQPILQKEPTPPPELSSHLSSEGEDDDFPYECPYVTYHPRPAAMCSYGGRLSGSCYTFNRKQDLFRAAFSHAVERHLHPPPHKKLCVESRLPQELHMPVESKDPYDFDFFDVTSSFGGPPPGGTPNPNAVNKPKQSSPTKLVSPPCTPTQTTMPMNRTIKPRDNPAGGKSPVQAAGPKVPFTSAKRKRSVSSQEPTNSVSSVSGGETTYSGATNTLSSHVAAPISISIPSGINLGTVGSINAALQAANKNCILTKNDVLKDVTGLVVTGIDATIANGQLINISSASLADITQLQNSIHIQNSSVIDKQVNQGAKVKMKTNSTKLKSGNKLQNLNDIRAANNIFGLPSGTFIMESTTQPGTLIATQAPLTTLANSNSAANITAMSPPSHPSPSTTPSPLYRSGSVSPQVSTTSPLPNGIVSTPSAVSVKGLPTGANHVPVTIAVNPANRSIPSPSRTNPGQGSPNHTGQLKITGKNHGGQNAGRHNPMFNKTSANSAKAQTGHLSGTLNVSHPGRLVTAASLQQQRYANQMLVSQTNPLVKSNSSSRASKSATQVPLLTAGNIVMTQQTLQSDERTRRELQQCIKTEPSDMIS
ncbi:ataxin-7-like protein 1 [Lineus longissimus]|uniref:ataxin-7-like protein 1 n=1 Tax=Lineus longissimus TaxID=88925 RepID=UPI002B4D2ADD